MKENMILGCIYYCNNFKFSISCICCTFFRLFITVKVFERSFLGCTLEIEKGNTENFKDKESLILSYHFLWNLVDVETIVEFKRLSNIKSQKKYS